MKYTLFTFDCSLINEDSFFRGPKGIPRSLKSDSEHITWKKVKFCNNVSTVMSIYWDGLQAAPIHIYSLLYATYTGNISNVICEILSGYTFVF